MSSKLVLQNVKYVTGERVDMVIKHNKIEEITEAGNGTGDRIIDCSGKYISSGWIDMHVHAFSEFSPYGDDIDEIGVKQGVTTIVDAGSCGASQIGELISGSKSSKTNVLAFLNISSIGLKRIDELSNLEWINQPKLLQAVEKYHAFIVGLKARISKSVVGDNGIEPLLIARQLSDHTALPLMVHIGSGPPKIASIIDVLEERDIITHYLHGKENNLFDQQKRPIQQLTNAIKRGVHLDVGHGTASFSFQVAEAAKQNEIEFNTISTDIYKGNRLNGPVYSLASVLTKFLYLGYTLKEVIDGVTIHPARWLNKPELGRMKVGDIANLTLFSIKNAPIRLIDSMGEERTGETRIVTEGVVIGEQYLEC